MRGHRVGPALVRRRAPGPVSADLVGAVVVGGDYQGLGIVRSLGRRGIPACVVDDEHSIARFSRFTTHAVRVGDLRNERATVDTLLEVAARLRLQGWVLYPTRDETVAALSHHRDQLSQQFRVPTPDFDAVRWAWDKRNTYRLAEKLDIPIPRTWYPDPREDLGSIDADPPLVIKPAIKESFFYTTKAKAWRADTRGQLVQRFQEAVAVAGEGGVMVQELIPGDGSQQFAYCGFFKDGSAVASMVVRRRRQHPPQFGRASTYVETIELPVLEQLSERFLRAIDYYGLVELEYKRDARTNEYKLLDVNARTWGYHSLGQRAGVDFPYLLFIDQAGGQMPPPCRAAAGIRWIRLLTDLPVGAREVLLRRLGLRDYVMSVTSSDVESVFSWEDPLPGLAEVALVPYLGVKRGF
jgi:D-aspartate ligase